MPIEKVFAEIGRLHLEIMQLKEQLAELQKAQEPIPPKAES